MKKSIGVCAVVVCLLGATANAQKSYVLQAPRWGAAQVKAVTGAGGTVVFGHNGAGVGVATSSAPDFLDRVRASSAITSAAADMVVKWQPDVRVVEAGDPTAQSINPADDRFYPLQWAPAAVKAPEAWAKNCTGEGVRVAILDGGIHSTHVDLAPNLDVARSASFVPGFAFNQDTGTFWHGTHVAGIVAAADNNIGTIGIAPKATLVGVKVLHEGSGAFSWIIQGILYASTPIAAGGGGADIINMSLGARLARNAGAPGEAAELVSALNRAVMLSSA
ncbi:MAG: S8 family serine peptidase [Bryobacteraceae bacterium]|nr:S8 family serine peptidase [Bryobacteraceae bacterium]